MSQGSLYSTLVVQSLIRGVAANVKIVNDFDYTPFLIQDSLQLSFGDCSGGRLAYALEGILVVPPSVP